MHRTIGIRLLAGLALLVGLSTTPLTPGWAQQDGNTCDVQGENRDCPNGILAGANLAGTDLTGANLSGTDLSGANLSGVILTDANLTGANLQDAYLYGATLTRTRLTNANLARADLLDADIAGAIFDGAQFGQTVCPDGHLTDGPGC